MANKRLFRVTGSDTQVGGVSIGLADYFNLDITLVRVLFVILFFTPFPAVITYVILWAILPVRYAGSASSTAETYGSTTDPQSTNTNISFMKNRNSQGSLVGGAILIILGIIFSFKTFLHINVFQYIGQMWPLFLIALGVWLVIREKPNDNDPFDNDSIGGSSSSDLLK
jgi:phage shock protein PspC (stress-responsive transcriptional regulator)